MPTVRNTKTNILWHAELLNMPIATCSSVGDSDAGQFCTDQQFVIAYGACTRTISCVETDALNLVLETVALHYSSN